MAATRVFGMPAALVVMRTKEGEAPMQFIGEAASGEEGWTKDDRGITIVYRLGHFNSAGGGRKRFTMLGRKKVEPEQRGEHGLVTRWSDTLERKSYLDRAGANTKEMVQTGRDAAAVMWRHIGGSAGGVKDTGWRNEQQRENEQTMTTLSLMFVMVGLSALGGAELAAAVAVVSTAAVAMRGRRRHRRSARMIMVLAVTSMVAWATVGSGGGDLNGGALGCPPGVHAMGLHGTSVQQHRPANIVHTLNFIGHMRERPLVIGFDTFSELNVVRRSVVERSWRVLDHEVLRVTGVGEARFGKLLEMPIGYRYTGMTQGLQVRVADDQHMPTGSSGCAVRNTDTAGDKSKI